MLLLSVAAHLAAHLAAHPPASLRQKSRVLPDAPAAPSTTKTGEIRNLGVVEAGRAGGDPPGSFPTVAAAGVGPSWGEGVKTQALSGWKRSMGSGEGRGTHKGMRHKKAFVCLSLC